MINCLRERERKRNGERAPSHDFDAGRVVRLRRVRAGRCALRQVGRSGDCNAKRSRGKRTIPPDKSCRGCRYGLGIGLNALASRRRADWHLHRKASSLTNAKRRGRLSGMASTIRRNCKTCGGPRPFTKSGINHILHLLLSILTFGFWIPVWILLGLLSLMRPHRCEHCGQSTFV